MTYEVKLNQTKSTYPFARWRRSEIEVYSAENCARMQKIFDDLIADLIAKGGTSSEEAKIESFYAAIKATNVLDDETNGMVETGEREDLCELTNVITEAAGLDPDKYGKGEGLASEWRDW